MKDNPYWEGSPTALVALINMDIQPHVITRKLNVLAGRLYTEHGILFRSERVHEGRKLRFWKDCVTVRDGCDGIFDSRGGIKITVTTVTYRHVLSRKGWIRWEMCKYHRNYLCSCSAFT